MRKWVEMWRARVWMVMGLKVCEVEAGEGVDGDEKDGVDVQLKGPGHEGV